MFRLKEIRLECGIKRSKVAEDLQINAGTIANYENQIRQAPYEYLVAFADYFEVSVDYLLGRSDDEIPLKMSVPSISAEEYDLIKTFRALNKTGKNRVLEYAELWKLKDRDL